MASASTWARTPSGDNSTVAMLYDPGYRMIFDLPQVKIYIRPGPTDMRKQINGLSVIVESVIGFSPFSGNLFLFCGKTKAVLKVLYWD
jgi:transposase